MGLPQMSMLPRILPTGEGPCADTTGPAKLRELLELFEEEASNQGAPVKQLLQSGLEVEQVERLLQEVGLGAPDELVALYSWRNGMKDPQDFPLARAVLPRWDFPSLQAAIINYKAALGSQEKAAQEHPDWPVESITAGTGSGWLRITENLIGCSVYCMGKRELPPRLRYNDPEFGSPGTANYFQAVSLTTWVTWLIQGIRNGAYRWNSSGQSWDETWSLAPESQRAVHFG